MPGIFIYQIAYPQCGPLDPAFLVLDNFANERPDWFEYWPIRNFLLSQSLDEDSFYGFLSPRFKEKTNLTAEAVRAFVGSEANSADVVTFTPSLQVAAYFQNVFMFGDFVHPGLLEIARTFFDRIEVPADLQYLVTAPHNEVYCNYMIARPRFWRTWLSITEQLFNIAEAPADPLGAELRRTTLYRGRHDAQIKVFVLERLATWILASDPRFVVRYRDPFAARSRVYKVPGAILCDALKIAFLASNRKPMYMDLFRLISKLRRLLGWQIRLLALLRFAPIRDYLCALSANWTRAAEKCRSTSALAARCPEARSSKRTGRPAML